jgi:hypothetical protein
MIAQAAYRLAAGYTTEDGSEAGHSPPTTKLGSVYPLAHTSAWQTALLVKHRANAACDLCYEYVWRSGGIAPLFLCSVLAWGEGSASAGSTALEYHRLRVLNRKCIWLVSWPDA